MNANGAAGRGAADARYAEHERTFREAQRAADTIFSHYQLSQLLASHARSASMAGAVLDELMHVCAATRGGIWLTHPSGSELRLVAQAGEGPMPAAAALQTGSPEGREWAVVELEEVGLLALASAEAEGINADAGRFLSLVRHELAAAFRSAQLGEMLETERTELAAIIKNASDAILVFDAERRVTRLNPAAERLFGRAGTSIAGQHCSRLYACERPPGSAVCTGCPLARVLASGEPLNGDERVIAAGGDVATAVVASYSPTSATADGGAGAVAILRDTSELARLAELRRGFLAAVSHELRTPIALIKGYVETLLHLKPDPAASHRYLERIDDTANRLGHLVEQILDATQLAAGQMVLDLEEFDLAPLLVETANQLAVGSRAPMPELAIGRELPRVHADRDRLREVLENLLGNAQKYGNDTPITIRADEIDGTLEIRISDGGIGIPAGERELVFEQFHRGRNVRERGISGSGLGLALSRRIVEAHGGTLGFDSASTAGATAILRLPTAAPVASRHGAESLAAASRAP